MNLLKQRIRNILVFVLILEARAVVRRHEPRVIAVTGSVGKTSTKDAIFDVVARTAYARKSQKSYNSDIGLPLTILGRPNAWNNPLRWAQNLLDGLFLALLPARYPEWLVLEVGADRPGDIQKITKWLPVDIAVVTRLPEMPVHVEFFSSPEEVVREKAALLQALKSSGTLVLYADDERGQRFKTLAEGRPVITFGLSSHAEVRAEAVELLFEEGRERWPVGMKARLCIGQDSFPIEVVGSVGTHTLLPALAACAVGLALEMPPLEILEGLKCYEPPPGRMHLLPGLKHTLLIDDTYNSSPAAVEAALETLRTIPASRRIAVLGDMLELGRYSVDEHRKLGAHVARTCSLLSTVGFRARDIAQGALDAGMADSAILQFEDAEKAGEELAAIVREGDCLLIKGSQGVRMERTVKALMAKPGRAEELLVRQDKEWRRR